MGRTHTEVQYFPSGFPYIGGHARQYDFGAKTGGCAWLLAILWIEYEYIKSEKGSFLFLHIDISCSGMFSCAQLA